MTTQIRANVLKTFIDKATVNGLVEDCKLVFTDNGISMRHKDLPGVILVEAELSKDAFEVFEKVSDINVKNSKTLSSVLKTFGENIVQIVVKDNQVVFQTENGGYQLTLAEDVVCYKDKSPELSYAGETFIPVGQLKLIVERNKIVNSDLVYVTNKDSQLALKVGKESDTADVIISSDITDEIATQFDATYFEEITKVFNEVATVSLDSKKPSKFVEKANGMTVTVYISKLVTNDEF
jgi:hypothetical protein